MLHDWLMIYAPDWSEKQAELFLDMWAHHWENSAIGSVFLQTMIPLKRNGVHTEPLFPIGSPANDTNVSALHLETSFRVSSSSSVPSMIATCLLSATLAGTLHRLRTKRVRVCPASREISQKMPPIAPMEYLIAVLSKYSEEYTYL